MTRLEPAVELLRLKAKVRNQRKELRRLNRVIKGLYLTLENAGVTVCDERVRIIGLDIDGP